MSRTDLRELGKQTRFKKGQSGNPSGRPKSKTLSDAYRVGLTDLVPGDPQERTYAEMIAHAQLREAIKGETTAAREIADRTEGKARQPIEMVAKVEVRAVLIDRAVRPPKPKK